MKNLLLVLCLVLSFNSYANDCVDLAKCTEHVSKLTGKKYLYDGSLKGDFKASTNLKFTADNADTLFSYVLNLAGYSRVPTVEKDTYKIVASRDIRYETLPLLSASLTETPAIPKNEDYYSLTYTLTHFKDGQSREIANSLRPFMSRYGRIIELYGASTITIMETASKLPQLLEIIKRSDRVLTKEEIALRKEREVRMDKKKAQNEKNGSKEDKPTNEPKK